MSTFTENYDLIKPDTEDYYDIQDFNENMDAIDAQLAQAEERMTAIKAGMAQAEEVLAAINAKIGTPPSGQTVVSMLQNGGSVIRSIQHVVYSAPGSGITSGSLAISPVNPTKTFVIAEQLYNSYKLQVQYNYTLSSNALALTHPGYVANEVQIGFWIVEFV